MTGPLVTTDWLAGHLDDSVLRPADVRWYLGEPELGKRAYAKGHIQNAFHVHLENDLSAADGPGRHPLPDGEVFADRMGQLGIGDDSVVVAYDDRGGGVAARLWWMLRAIGHQHSYVLDGGLTAWIADGHPLTTELPQHPASRLSLHPGSGLTMDRDEMRQQLGSIVAIDARAAERFRGETEPIDAVAGHIPGASNAPYEDNLGPDQRFLPPEMLGEKYRSLGVGGPSETVVYCGSGVTACHDLLAIEHAGLGPAKLYPGSWSDWSSAGYEVATGPE